MRKLGGALVMGLVLTAGCSGGSDSPDAAPEPAATDVCAEVRAGIDAFNEGDISGTIARFRDAVPLAVAQAEEDDSQEAADLVEAVKYYAELDAAQYLEASISSPDFAKYKAITLGQCVPVEQPDAEPPPVTT